MKVINQYGKEIYYESAVALMDNEIRERVHSIGFKTEQEFFNAYCDAHLGRFCEEFICNTENPQY